MAAIEPGEFKRIYDLHAGPLYRYLFRFTASGPAAEEILHDIFLQLLAGECRLDDERDGIKAWLFAVAKNRGLNYTKRAANRTIKVATEMADLEGPERTSTPEDILIQKNLLDRLAHSEPNLPADLRETWALRKEGFDYQEIASRLSIPIGTVKSRFSRLISVLRTEFSYETPE